MKTNPWDGTPLPDEDYSPSVWPGIMLLAAAIVIFIVVKFVIL